MAKILTLISTTIATNLIKKIRNLKVSRDATLRECQRLQLKLTFSSSHRTFLKSAKVFQSHVAQLLDALHTFLQMEATKKKRVLLNLVEKKREAIERKNLLEE